MTRNEGEMPKLRDSVTAAFRADEPAAVDVQRAYLRFSWARRKAAPRFRAPALGWLVAGIAIGMGAASAATLVSIPGFSTRAELAELLSNGAVAAKEKSRKGHRQARPSAAPPLAVSADPVEAAEPAELPTAVGVVIREEKARLLPSAASVPSPGLLAGPSAAGTADRRAEPLAARAVPSDWQSAAAALRSGNFSQAEAALSKIESGASEPDREAAALARAQLLIRNGRGREVRGLLERLTREGHSELVRSQAATVLRGLLP